MTSSKTEFRQKPTRWVGFPWLERWRECGVEESDQLHLVPVSFATVAPVAQGIEQEPSKLLVGGSNPSWGALSP